MFQMYKKLEDIELIILNIVGVALVIVSILVFKKLKKEIDKIGDM